MYGGTRVYSGTDMYSGTTTAGVPKCSVERYRSAFFVPLEIPYHFKLRIPELSLKNSEEGNWKEKIG